MGERREKCAKAIGLAWLPFLSFMLATLTFIISYSISSKRDLTITSLPFISDTGALSPASCWFTFFLNTTAYCFMAVAAVRFLHIREHLGHDRAMIRAMNVATFVIAILGSLGMSGVAAFQETNVISMHLLGAFVAFIGAIIYGAIQCHLTHLLIKETTYLKSTLMVACRIALTCISFICLFTCTIPLKPSGYEMPPYNGGNTTVLPYNDAHLYYMATTSEWLLAAAFFIYILTFIYEFQYLHLSAVVHTHHVDPMAPPSHSSEALSRSRDQVNTNTNGPEPAPAPDVVS